MSKRHRKHRQGYNIHHRKPKAQGGGNSPSNTIEVSIIKHRYWTMLFDGQKLAHTICSEINNVWLDPAFKFVCVDTRNYEKVRKFVSELT